MTSAMPEVLRARGFRLYTKNGRRLVDLWQNGGAAILGHTPPNQLRELKNAASRGLYAPFPHFTCARFLKALSRVFPGRNFRLYAAPPPQLETMAAEGAAALWRPFTDPGAPLAVPENAPPVLIPVVPGIQGWRASPYITMPLGLCVFAIKNDYEPMPSLPPDDCISPLVCAAAARGIHDIAAAVSRRTIMAYPRIAQALNGGRPEHSRHHSGRWQCNGLYLSPRHTVSNADWAALFHLFLENGFLLPPATSQPVILPGELSPGEEAKLAGLLEK